jgi:NAD-dependent dihydropyrimidine dehydrogenase PreA subunit
MRADGIFIAVDVDDHAAADSALASTLTDACPVDIFAQRDDGTLSIVESKLDECVLCGLCLDAAPQGAISVLKLYDGEAVLARA